MAKTSTTTRDQVKPDRKWEGKAHAQEAERYVDDVLSGAIPACTLVKLACRRHLGDLERSRSNDFAYRFDPALGHRVCAFVELLPHTKGKWAKPLPGGQILTTKLEPWQKFILCMIFGWVKKSNGKRRFTKARIYVPRKNGKSHFAACLALYMLACDGEFGAEVYTGATSEKQSLEVFGPARQIAMRHPKLAPSLGIQINANSLVIEGKNSKMMPIIGNPGDGSSPHCSITDEYHEHRTSNLLDTMETGMGAREQPLSLVISTAGMNTAGPCREDWQNCEKILRGIPGFDDETVFAMIFTIDDGDQWDTEAALQKANPNWGVSINPDQILADMRAAQHRASRQSAFKTKHLNLWVSVKEAFFNLGEWQKQSKSEIRREDFKEFPCYLSGDLASKHDLVALMQLFCLPDKRFALFGKYYIPRSTLELPENQHYRNWHIDGWIEVAGDEVTDLDHFKEDVLTYCKEFNVLEMPSDPNRAWGVFPALEKEGVPVVEYRNTVLMMSEPMKELDALIRAGRIIHNGDPVLTWAIANTTAKLDKKDNVFPNKETNANKIDPVVATIMAIGRAMTREERVVDAPFFGF
jgi:phage terminase large subunit-like protein